MNTQRSTPLCRAFMVGALGAWLSIGLAAPSAQAAQIVMSGAMDICQAVDNGETTIADGLTACCAQEVTEYDNGHIDFGKSYCVVCVTGTDDCYMYDTARAPVTIDVRQFLDLHTARR